MNITISQRKEGAKAAVGLTVVIDVFRAFTTACYVMANGADRIIPVRGLDDAYALKQAHPEYVLMGERGGVIQEGFDYGNSPFLIKDVDFSGNTVVHTTSCGTKGIAHAKQADEIITGSFVNAGAIISYIKSKNPTNVSLVCTGTLNETILDEDAMCAQYIKNALLDEPNDMPAIVKHLKEEGFGKSFFDPEKESHPEEDFYMCMDVDHFDFVLQVHPYENDLVQLKRM